VIDALEGLALVGSTLPQDEIAVRAAARAPDRSRSGPPG
jgi:hypothetical protein